MNKIIKGIALDKHIRVLGINSRDIIEEITQSHQTSPCASAALGRTLSITALMGAMRNNDKINITITGDGPLGHIYAQYLPNQTIRGYVDNPNIEPCINANGKLDVSQAVGRNGSLSVIIKSNEQSDYYGSVELVSGEISEDFTYYFAASEQIPSIVSAGVLVDTDGSVKSSGALIVQLLPEAEEEDIVFLENNMQKFINISDQLLTKSMLEIINEIFSDFQLLEETHIDAGCTCSREDMYAKISTLSLDDLKEILEEDEQLETVCPWCNSKYLFLKDDLEKIIENKESGCFLYN